MQGARAQTSEMKLPSALRPAIALAIHSHDQLRTIAGMGGAAHLSFDQTAVEAVSRMHSITLTPTSAMDLKIIQAEGLKILAEQQ